MNNTFNDLGIGKELDWSRIRKLFIIGLCAGVMVLIGDMLLGWGLANESLEGLEGILSAYLSLFDSRIFWSSFLGFIGIPIEALCYFGIYRLIAPYSEKYAHMYRTGILGYLAFGGCGVHVPCLASVFFYKYMMQANPEQALQLSIHFASYFLLPGMVMLIIFWLIHSYAQISAFAKGLTPYPKWCWIFSMPVGMVATELLHLIGNHAIVNALTAGWISIGNIWMFAGLLIMMNKVGTNK